MKKIAVCVGINDYPGQSNDLRGCVNDAEDWSKLLSGTYGYAVQKILDGAATRANVIEALKGLVDEAGPGDRVAFTYSGHGTWVPDQGEADESDNRDEALALADGILVDDEIRLILAKAHPDASVSIVSDSCFSGSITRSFLKTQRAAAIAEADGTKAPIPRFMPPEDDMVALRAAMLPVRRRAFYPEGTMSHVLLTGCNATEYSYDAHLNGNFNGAMTYFAIQLIKAVPGRTWRDLHKALRKLLPSTSFPQSPQLEGPNDRKDRPVFT